VLTVALCEDSGLVALQEFGIVERAMVMCLPPTAVNFFEYACRANCERQFTFIDRETLALAADCVEDIAVFVDRLVVESTLTAALQLKIFS
jgi:hypothetical protein